MSIVLDRSFEEVTDSGNIPIANSSTVISCENLEVRYPSDRFFKRYNPLKDTDTTGVKGVDLSVQTGDIVLVAGASGHGKTSLLKALSGSFKEGEAKVSGSVLIDGREISQYDLKNSSRVVGGFHETYGSQEIPLEVLDRLSRSRSNDIGYEAPALVVLDEPTRGLDSDQFKDVEAQIKAVAEHSAVIIVSHDISMGLAMSNQFVHLCNNHVTYQGLVENGQLVSSDIPDITNELIALARRMDDQAIKKQQPVLKPVPDEVFKETKSFENVGNSLSVKSLSVVFNAGMNNEVHAVNDVSFDVRKGEVLAFIGPSGCGKSSIVKSLNRMLPDSALVTGAVELDGRDVNAVGTDASFVDIVDVRKQYGYVAQKAQTFPHMTIIEEVTYGAVLHGLVENNEEARRDLAEELLTRVGLWDEIKDDVETRTGVSLSGGQQQRLTIARALAVEPKVLLMDEPCSALDPIATATVEETIRNLAEEGQSIVIVTHQMHQAARVADRTAFMFKGEMVEINDTYSLMRHPAEKKTDEFVRGLHVT